MIVYTFPVSVVRKPWSLREHLTGALSGAGARLADLEDRNSVGVGDGARPWEQHQQVGGRAWLATSDSILLSGSLRT